MFELKTDTKNIGIEQARAIAYTRIASMCVACLYTLFQIIPLSLCAFPHRVSFDLTLLASWMCVYAYHCIYIGLFYLFHRRNAGWQRKLFMPLDSVYTFVASFDFLIKSQRRDEHTAPISACYLSIDSEKNLKFCAFPIQM